MTVLLENTDNTPAYQEKLFWAKFELLNPEDKEIVLAKIEEFLNKKEQRRMDQITSDGNNITPPDEK